MKKQDIAGLLVYVLILALAAVFGLVVIRNYASSGKSGMEMWQFVLFVIGAILAGLIGNSILYELAHMLGAKIGGYKVTSVSILGFTWTKNEGKTTFHFASFDGLTGETKIIPIQNRKKPSNPIPFLVTGTVIYAIEVVLVVFAFSILTKDASDSTLTNLGYFFLIFMAVGGMILIYNIIPFQLDSTTDGYRLRLVSGKKNRDAFNAMLLGKTVEETTGEQQQVVETSFSSNLKINQVYKLLDEEKYVEAEQLLDSIIEDAPNDKKMSGKTLFTAKALKVFLIFINQDEKIAFDYCEKNIPLRDRRDLSDESDLASIRAYLLIAGLIDKSKSEVNRTLDKVFKAYKHTPENRRSLESKLYNKALKLVSDKHPDWGIEEYAIKEQ